MIRTNFRSIALVSIGSCLMLSACLQTRDSQEEETQQKVMQKQVYNQQTSIADTKQRLDSMDDDIRNLGGKTETNENRISVVGNKLDKAQQNQALKDKDQDARLKTIQDAVSKLDTDIAVINQQITVLAEQQKQAAASAAAAASGASTASTSSAKKEDAGKVYDSATALYDKKKWKDAALEFERYRKAAPKAKNIPEATYRIGVCFQEMGSNDDAQAFYEEVAARFPKSSEAKRANIRLKALKKK